MAENIQNVKQTKAAEFHKLYGDAREMYQAASPEKINNFLASANAGFHLFPVPQEYSVCDFKNVPAILFDKEFTFAANPGEFYVLQILVWSPGQGLGNIRLKAENVPFSWRCFNLPQGKRLNIASHSLQPLWVGIEIPASVSGSFPLTFIVETENFEEQRVVIPLSVHGEVLGDGGESDDRRMARLRWLDSDIGISDTVFPPFTPIVRQGRTLSWLGHTMELGDNGLPLRITSSFCSSNTSVEGKDVELIEQPISFTSCSREGLKGELEFTWEKETEICWRVQGMLGSIPACLKGSLEFDGRVRFQLKLFPAAPQKASFKLEISHAQNDFFMGLNRHGGYCPERIDWYWNPEECQDGYWIGNINGGMKVRLYDHDSITPLVNAYYKFSKLKPPRAWYNDGCGGISLKKTGASVSASLFSGTMELAEKSEYDFSFEFLVTPFHPTSQEMFFKEHFYQPYMHAMKIDGGDPLEQVDFDALRGDGVTCINIHHAVNMNPVINYPFTNVSLPQLVRFVNKAHENGFKVICYYTIRELTIHAPEFWTFRSMGDEIFYPGLGENSRPCTNPAGPNKWLCEHLKTNFLPAWAEVVKNGPIAGTLDLSLETTPGGRLENFYLEGLRYLLERCPLDGIYLDDTSLSVEGFRRLWRIFFKIRNCAPIIDFHAWNPFPFDRTLECGNVSVAYREMEKLPYYTDLWLGENFDYEKASAEYYLTEISGIPYGLSSEMLYAGGNPWRGILFGMTSRYGWAGDPRNLWSFFEKFGTDGLKIETDFEKSIFDFGNPLVRASRFTNSQGKELIAVASWCQEKTVIHLPIACFLPEIPDFQNNAMYEAGDSIELDPGKGIILVKQ